jgi:excisionase family DNA binding protein
VEDEMGDVEGLHDVFAGDALLLTPEEAAKLLRLGRTTVYALIKAGDLRPVHIGRSCRISHAELERFVSRLDAPPPIVPRRSPARRRTSTDQGGLFELGSTSPDVA